ncbi:AAA family ATPase [Rhodococcoides kyotonense]|uniref:AAA family ATPase n=1 Tax=Rhodococcoides kyotonense TaxID=398843 RepID=A0A177Y7Q7_9NOCA|nr:AAA family ATPase [Rhodococcus kyotonensis]
MILGPADTLTGRPSRVIVAGTSGSGKTTLASRIALVLGTEHIEIDGLFHGPGWTPRPSFEADVDEFSSRPSWVTEWQYASVRDKLADRADLLVWLDLPRTTVMRQVSQRTIGRRLRREVLWNGNIEPPLRSIFREEDHIIRWAWRTHSLTGERVLAVAERRPELSIVQLQSRADVEQWVTGALAEVT